MKDYKRNQEKTIVSIKNIIMIILIIAPFIFIELRTALFAPVIQEGFMNFVKKADLFQFTFPV
jgi:hypothetical protein